MDDVADVDGGGDENDYGGGADRDGDGDERWHVSDGYDKYYGDA